MPYLYPCKTCKRSHVSTEGNSCWPCKTEEAHDRIDELRAQLAEVEAEMLAIRHAAHMPEDYEHGLPSWINQHLYGKLLTWTAKDGGPVRRSDDIGTIITLKAAMDEIIAMTHNRANSWLDIRNHARAALKKAQGKESKGD